MYSQYFEYMQQSCTLTPLRDEKGQVENIVVSVQNVTESVYLEQNLKLMTQQDSLTGIYNRRFLDRRLEEEFKRFRRSGRRFSLLMIDIDNFKMVNDNYGHQFGDQVLKVIARCCSDEVRGSDIVARFGGEEFAVALMDSSAGGAVSFAERLRKSIESCKVTTDTGTSINVTVSIGVDEVSEKRNSWQEILGCADAALYDSKKRGKNRVTLYEPSLDKTAAKERRAKRKGD
jgi:diguanylate cyclase (GGDEF)-like protein